jgi:phage terminase Nu1 subunit (DNA packaging protein)
MSLRYLSQSQLSEVTGKDARTVKKRLAGIKPHSEDGRSSFYDTHVAIPLIMMADTAATNEKKLQQLEVDIVTEKLKALRYENEEQSGRLVPIEEVVKEIEREYGYVRSQIRSIPSKLAKPLSIITDPHEVHARLSDAVDECLTELVAQAKYEIELNNIESVEASNSIDADTDTSSSAETDAGGMG